MPDYNKKIFVNAKACAGIFIFIGQLHCNYLMLTHRRQMGSTTMQRLTEQSLFRAQIKFTQQHTNSTTRFSLFQNSRDASIESESTKGNFRALHVIYIFQQLKLYSYN